MIILPISRELLLMAAIISRILHPFKIRVYDIGAALYKERAVVKYLNLAV